MDKSAVGHEHIEKVEKHASQTDGTKGFGGKFGVQKDRYVKTNRYWINIIGWWNHVDTFRMDKSAVGHDYVAKVEKHESQTDGVKGFGGKFGVQSDRKDKVRLHFSSIKWKIKSPSFLFQSAVGWDYQEKLVKHESQTDGVKGFGGKFGVQTDRVDKVHDFQLYV